jgi:hypothetical protein
VRRAIEPTDDHGFLALVRYTSVLTLLRLCWRQLGVPDSQRDDPPGGPGSRRRGQSLEDVAEPLLTAIG